MVCLLDVLYLRAIRVNCHSPLPEKTRASIPSRPNPTSLPSLQFPSRAKRNAFPWFWNFKFPGLPVCFPVSTFTFTFSLTLKSRVRRGQKCIYCSTLSLVVKSIIIGFFMGLNFEESFIKPILSKSTLFSLTIQNRFLKTFRFFTLWTLLTVKNAESFYFSDSSLQRFSIKMQKIDWRVNI